MKKILFIIIGVLLLSTNAFSALTVGNVPKVKTGGSSPAIENSSISESGGNVTISGTISASNLSGTNTGDQTNITGNAATATTASGLSGNIRADQVKNAGTNVGGTYGSFTNTWTSSAGDARFFTIDTGVNDVVVRGDGNVGINTTDPSTELQVAGTVTATAFAGSLTGNVTGNADTATALAANGSNCSAGSYPLGVDASGAVENCTVAGTGSSTVRYDQITDPGTHSGENFASLTNIWTSALTTSAFFTLNGSGEDWTVLGNGNLGIGDATPTASLVVGLGDAFAVNSSGAVTAATGVTSSGTITFSGLTNCDTLDTNGSGVLSCGTDATGGASVSSGKVNNLQDADNSAGLSWGANFTNSWTSNATTGDFFTINGNSMTTGDLLTLSVGQMGGAGDIIEINRGGTNVAGVDGYGQLRVGSMGGSRNGNSGVTFGAFTNTWTSSLTTSEFFRIDGSTIDVSVLGNGNVGIGDSTPTQSLVVGSGDKFTVDSSGNVGLSGGGVTLGANNLITMSTFTNSWTSAASSGFIWKIADSDEGELIQVNEDATVVIGEATDASYFTHLKGYTSDPCGTIPARSYFWNDTANEPCVCIVGGTDIRVKDMTTACF